MSPFNKSQIGALLTYGGAWGAMMVFGWPGSDLTFLLGFTIPWSWLIFGPMIFAIRPTTPMR